MKKYYKFLIGLVFISNQSFAQQITVNNSFTAQALADNFINGTCTTTSNIRAQGYTFSDQIKSWGYFNKGTSNFPFDEGIVLTTGKLSDAPGPKRGVLSEGPRSWRGDRDLENAAFISDSYNATILEFDFIPTSNMVSFDYIFASEQYLTSGTQSQCAYTDGFAFILSNVTAGTPGVNLALVPGTNTPVKSNTIRGAGGLCPPINAQYFASYNNQRSAIAYNGNTVPLTVQSAVIPGHTYHIKMVIADQGNELYDSAVFLRANSFKSTIDLGIDRLKETNNALCANERLMLDTQITDATYKWFKNGTLITGASQRNYEVRDTGTYKVEITQTNGCISEGEIKVEFDPFNYNDNIALEVCGVVDENTATFNLVNATNLIIIDTPNSISFFRNNNNGVLSNPINQNIPFTATTGTQVYAKLISESGCEYITTITLLINTKDIEAYHQIKCDSSTSGYSSFNLPQIAQNILVENNYPPNYVIYFYLTIEDANNNTNILPNNFTNTVAFEQQIYAKITVNGTCVAIMKVFLNVVNTTTIPIKKILICKGEKVTLTASSTSAAYIWNTNETSKSIEVTNEGTYTVKYLSIDGCEITEQFEVSISSPPTQAVLHTVEFSASKNSITVIVAETGLYEFSLDGINYQFSNVFLGLSEGKYNVHIRDVAGCGELILTTYISDYPRFVTPNGDGFNDTWRIPNLSVMDPGAITQIFDRYGQLIFQMQAPFAWDGTRNGKEMPSTDYWFVVRFTTGKELRGHFSLVR